jgi:hypothetical protein
MMINWLSAGLVRLRAWMLSWILAAAIAAGLAGAWGPARAAEYIGSSLTDVKPEDRAVVGNPQPVQVLIQFQTKGAPNGRATKYVKQQVLDTVKASGLFSDVSEAPTANGAILSVVINNVAAPKDIQEAEAKGFVTGATFFIAGSNVADYYDCTVDYVAGPSAPKITRTAHHSLITQVGLINKPPTGAVKVGAIKDAVFMMVRQIVSNPLNEIGKDPAFSGAAVASTPPPVGPASVTPADTAQTSPATAQAGGAAGSGAGGSAQPAQTSSTAPATSAAHP